MRASERQPMSASERDPTSASEPATAVHGVDIHLLRDGRLAEHWDVVDIYGFLIQTGAVPAPAGAPGTA